MSGGFCLKLSFVEQQEITHIHTQSIISLLGSLGTVLWNNTCGLWKRGKAEDLVCSVGTREIQLKYKELGGPQSHSLYYQPLTLGFSRKEIQPEGAVFFSQAVP